MDDVKSRASLAGMSGTKATVIVSPRERFEMAVMSLESLYQSLDMPVRVIYIDGATPRAIASELRQMVGARGDTYVRSELFLTPNQARNIALEKLDAETEFVVFADNDVVFSPNWLSALVRCAEETGAGLVTPAILVGPAHKVPDVKIHHAGGGLAIEKQPGGGYSVSRRHGYEHQRYLELKDKLARHETDCTEFHAVLVRSAVLDQISPLDEKIVGFSDEVDMALDARMRGWKIWFEPASVITYTTGKKITREELPYFCARWEYVRSMEAEKYFFKKWGFVPEFSRQRGFLRDHRRHAFPFRKLQNVIGWRATVTLTALICEAIAIPALRKFAPVRHSPGSSQRYEIVDAHMSAYGKKGPGIAALKEEVAA